ncbi:MAG: trypsin-like peptidase domain-containing protein [Archangiaceae bacterium]|nr:trypsin-like peptidase domain-containing protein [Archangiaceae bacterium]
MNQPRAEQAEPVRTSDPLRKSVVKLFTVTRKPNHYEPWSHGYQHASGGSGCIIDGQRILTNAHVVTNAVFIQALKNGDVKKYVAKVEHVSHDEELAVLTVDDPSFFEDTLPVSWGGLPTRQDRVHVYGFPIGGNELSITAGVISRVEVISYTHSRRWLLALQTDAAINPGNSGGPVFNDGKLVGVAFQSHERTTAQSTGYVVPMPVIEHFRREVEVGECLGVPALGVNWQKIESEALREHARLKPGQSGVLISRVMYGGSAAGVIREGDVLLSVSGTRLEQDGTIILRGEDRVDFSHLVSQRRIGESLTCEILRGGKKLKVKLKMRGPSSLVPLPRPERQPTYFVFAGLMFVPLTAEYLASWEWKDVDVRFQHLYRDGLQTPQRREVVVVSHVLAHAANQGYHDIRGAIVERVNGKPIREMSDVVRAVKKPKGKLHVIEFDNALYTFGSHVALKASEIARATREVLSTYGVTKDRSADLENL